MKCDTGIFGQCMVYGVFLCRYGFFHSAFVDLMENKNNIDNVKSQQVKLMIHQWLEIEE